MGNEFIKTIKYYIGCLLEIIYSLDEECLICKDYVKNKNSVLCHSCMTKIKKCNSPYNIVVNDSNVFCYSGVYYSGIVKELISRLKYKSDFKAGEVLSEYMIQSIDISKKNIDLITYVPSTRKVLRRRGYNQSEFLAKIIGNKINIKVDGILEKVRDTKDQIGLSGEDRWNNLKNSYKVKQSKCISGKTILLIDDVITTGATGFFCTEDMLKSGCKEVYILTAARSKL